MNSSERWSQGSGYSHWRGRGRAVLEYPLQRNDHPLRRSLLKFLAASVVCYDSRDRDTGLDSRSRMEGPLTPQLEPCRLRVGRNVTVKFEGQTAWAASSVAASAAEEHRVLRFYSGINPDNFFSLQFAHFTKAEEALFAKLAPPGVAGASPLRARARRSQADAPHSHGQEPSFPASGVCLRKRLSLRNGNGAIMIIPAMLSIGPPPTPTHALGSRPSLDRFAFTVSPKI